MRRRYHAEWPKTQQMPYPTPKPLKQKPSSTPKPLKPPSPKPLKQMTRPTPQPLIQSPCPTPLKSPSLPRSHPSLKLPEFD
ncbi:hypothetical protein AAVH_06457 [Aphelenchoides avenae]|nr:hypothetical protein AAVH_06457 [Aphelenchus avenae]